MSENNEIKKDKKKKKRIIIGITISIITIIVAVLISTCIYSYVKYDDAWYVFKPHKIEEQKDSSSSTSSNISSSTSSSNNSSSSSSSSNNKPVDDNAVIPGKNGVLKTYYAVISKEEYYKDVEKILNTKPGNEIKTALNTLLNTNVKQPTYGDIRYMLPYTDERIDKKGTLYGIYDETEISSTWDKGHTWSREHVWPCNKMRIPPYDGNNYRPDNYDSDHRSDLHNLRAIKASTNSKRSDKYYDDTGLDGTYNPNQNKEDHRGDVARILFYMSTRYPELTIVETPSKSGTQMGTLSKLIKWNKEDPVDDFEIQRNNRIYEYQGNRNPYIDYPELADKVFTM